MDEFQDADRVTQVPSLCINCLKEGNTKFLLMKIPHFKDVLISAFNCPNCYYSNNEVQSVGAISSRGSIYKLLVSCKEDLNRQIVRSDHATIVLNELEIEIPSTGRSSITTVEGIVSKILHDLESDQESRKAHDPELFKKIDNITSTLRSYISLSEKFTLTLDDPSGCSYVESRCFVPLNHREPFSEDSNFSVKTYERTKEQQEALGYSTSDPDNQVDPSIYCFPVTCSNCGANCETRMHPVNIPYFKEVIIMSGTCDRCGFKSNEVKSGGEIPEQGKILSLKIASADDLSRDILKSDSCSLEIPEIDFRLGTGTLGGRFTTIEGILRQVINELEEKCGFYKGDSATRESRDSLNSLLERLNQLVVTIVLDDPLAASYIQNIYAPDPDPNMKIDYYDRSWEQNEEFGLNDIQVDQ